MRYVLSFSLSFFITTLTFSQDNTFKIGFLLDKNSVEINELMNELSDEISAVVGEDAVLEFPEVSKLVNNFDSSTALNNYNVLVENNTDIIIAFGVVNNAVISKIGTYQKPTIVFGALSEELLTDESLVSNITNYTSIVTSQSYTEDIKLLQKLASPKSIGVVVEKAFIDNLPIASTFNDISKDLNIEIKLIPFDSLSDITSSLDNIDAVYLAGGFYLSDSEMQELANALIEKRLPSLIKSI